MNDLGPMADAVTGRLALTLLHFLWQGLAVAGAVLLLSGLLRVRDPRGRYALSFIGLLLMAGCPVVTFALLPGLPTVAPSGTTVASESAPVDPPVGVVRAMAESTPGVPDPVSPAEEPSSRWPSFAAAQRWIVFGWLVGVGLLSARLALGWFWLRRFRRHGEPIPAALAERAEGLCRALGLRLPRIRVSRRVGEALVTGVVRPLVLLPAAWLTELPPDMLEAVLAHELAHLRRGDLWVLALQRAVETLLFYHPAVWWLSRRLRADRELCCDELAVAVTRDRFRYAQTLERVGRLASRGTLADTAASIGGDRMSLFKRIQHLLGRTPARPASRPWLATALVVLAPLAAWWLIETGPGEPARAGERGGEVTGTVVDPDGKPLPGVEVQAFKYRGRVDRTFRTDARGTIRVPKSWRTEPDTGYTLVVREPGRLGWFAFAQNRLAPGNDPSFRIVVAPLTQTARGILTDAQGNPLAGVPVRVDGFYSEANHWVYEPKAADDALIAPTATDETGQFAFKVPAGTSGELQPRHPEWVSVRVRWKPDQTDLGRVRLATAGRIEGRVVDAKTSRPVTGAEVGAQAYETDYETGGWRDIVSDREGRFVVGGLKPGVYNLLLMQVAGNERLTGPAVEAVKVEAGKAVRADLRVAEGRSVTGTVIDSETGKPLAECHVGYYGAARPRSGACCMMVKTDAQGAFRFHIPPGVSYFYIASGNRQQSTDATRTIEVPAERDPEPILLRAGPPVAKNYTTQTVCIPPEQMKKEWENNSYRLNAVLQATDSRPVTRVDLRLVYRGGRHTASWAGRSGGAFTYRFGEHEDGRTASFLIDADGFAPTRSPEFVIAKDMPPLSIKLEPAVYVPVRGRVVDAGGKPLAGARVRVGRVIFLSEKEFPWGVETATGKDGRYEFKHLRVGDRFYVRADWPGTGGAETERVLLQKASPVSLPDLRVGPPDQEIAGRLRDEDGMPVAGAKIVFRGEARVETMTDVQGHFRLRGLPTGDVRLNITAPGFQTGDLAVPAGKTNANLYLIHDATDQDLYRFRVELRPKDGKTVAKTQIWFVGPDKTRWDWYSSFTGNRYETNVRSSFRRWTGKAYQVVFIAEGYAVPRPVEVIARANPEPVVIDLVPAEPAKLSGRVLDADGRPVAGAKVGLSLALTGKAVDEPWRFVGSLGKVPVTDADGRFEFANLSAGSRVAVYVNKPGYAGVWSPRVAVGQGEQVALAPLRLDRATAELTGKVVNARGEPVAGARVQVYDFNRAETRSAADGSFRLEGAPAAETVLIIDAPDYEVAHREVKPGDKDIRIVLDKE